MTLFSVCFPSSPFPAPSLLNSGGSNWREAKLWNTQMPHNVILSKTTLKKPVMSRRVIPLHNADEKGGLCLCRGIFCFPGMLGDFLLENQELEIVKLVSRNELFWLKASWPSRERKMNRRVYSTQHFIFYIYLCTSTVLWEVMHCCAFLLSSSIITNWN